MQKIFYSITLCVFLFLLSSCTNNNDFGKDDNIKYPNDQQDNIINNPNENNNTQNNNDLKNYYSLNTNQNIVNGGNFSHDEKHIYFLQNNKLHSIDKSTNKQAILFPEYNIIDFIHYENKFIILCNIDGVKKYFSGDNNGTNIKHINIESTEGLCTPIVYMNNLYFTKETNDDFLYEVLKFDIESGKQLIDTTFDNVRTSFILPIIYNDTLYLMDCSKSLNLVKYDGKSLINAKFNGAINIETQIIKSIQIVDDKIFYFSKNIIASEELGNPSTAKVVINNDNYNISRINVSDKYIFFTNIINNYDKNNVIIEINRINHDGSNLKNIFCDTVNRSTNISSSGIYIIDNVVYYESVETGKINAFDFEGNLIEFDN